MAFYTLPERTRRTTETLIRVGKAASRKRKTNPEPYRRLTEGYGDLLAYHTDMRRVMEGMPAGQEREETIAKYCTEIAAICVLIVAEVTGVPL